MTDKEQIIIDGVTYYKQQDINEGLDEEHYITEFRLLATHYNLLLEDYARKAQECEIWKNQVLILDEESVTVQVTQEQFEEYQQLKQECKELKEYFQANQPTGICETCMATAILQNDKYYKVLEEIEEIVSGDYETLDPLAKKQIFNIINKAKGRLNEK